MPDFEVVFDPKEEAVIQGLLLGEEHEVMPDGDWIRHARRVTKIPDLFMYHHKRTGNYVLSKWVYGREACIELEAFPIPPDRGGWMPDDELVARCRPIHETVEAMKRRMKDAASQRASMMADDAEQKKQAIRSLKRRGLDEAAFRLQEGMDPWVGAARGGESYRQTCEQIRSLAKVS